MVSSAIHGLGLRWLGASALALALALGACGSPSAEEGVQINPITGPVGSLRRDVRIVVNRKKPGGPRGFWTVYRWSTSALVRTSSEGPSTGVGPSFGMPARTVDFHVFSCLGHRIGSVTQIATAAVPDQIIRSRVVDGMNWSLSTTDGSPIADGTAFSVLYVRADDPSCPRDPSPDDPCLPPPDDGDSADDRDQQVQADATITHIASKSGDETCIDEFKEGDLDPNSLLVVSSKSNGRASARYVPGRTNPWCIHYDDDGVTVAAGDRFTVDVYSAAEEQECSSSESGPSGPKDDAKDSEGDPKVPQIDAKDPEPDPKASEPNPRDSKVDPKAP